LLPEAVLPEAVLPEAVLPEAVLPEAVLPEAVLPEAVLCDSEQAATGCLSGFDRTSRMAINEVARDLE
jgi:hypothetical protein